MEEPRRVRADGVLRKCKCPVVRRDRSRPSSATSPAIQHQTLYRTTAAKSVVPVDGGSPVKRIRMHKPVKVHLCVMIRRVCAGTPRKLFKIIRMKHPSRYKKTGTYNWIGIPTSFSTTRVFRLRRLHSVK
ncbi:hypothetical protein Trydic_g5104 [Trypoxylus dichotomus]